MEQEDDKKIFNAPKKKRLSNRLTREFEMHERKGVDRIGILKE